ncbi:hypothetical protein NDI85_19675 [Halomicroarcula sp. S1AR25-4]|uniref:hypothetical protein n=1 Tax=Haloarcula sp. S1AR25-4 TaxID=2950538 RepID=UPI002875D951|nr:hypothetical protein [Halomicroarcula sp. S1AR25-4]MDS0280008.1 hypothetical protein [Halomicroarcula sp. S1AR25-4]
MPQYDHDDDLDMRQEPVSAVLAEMTGHPKEEFEVDDDAEFPDPDELETVPEDEW